MKKQSYSEAVPVKRTSSISLTAMVQAAMIAAIYVVLTFIANAFGLFTAGLDRFDEAYKDGTICRVLTTNLIYQTPELLAREWYIDCDMSKYIAYIIDTLNHDTSISDLLNPVERIQSIVAKYNTGELE